MHMIKVEKLQCNLRWLDNVNNERNTRLDVCDNKMLVCSFLGARKSLTSPDAAKTSAATQRPAAELRNWQVPYYKPSAPFLYEVAGHVNKNCHSGHSYYYYTRIWRSTIVIMSLLLEHLCWKNSVKYNYQGSPIHYISRQ